MRGRRRLNGWLLIATLKRAEIVSKSHGRGSLIVLPAGITQRMLAGGEGVHRHLRGGERFRLGLVDEVVISQFIVALGRAGCEAQPTKPDQTGPVKRQP